MPTPRRGDGSWGEDRANGGDGRGVINEGLMTEFQRIRVKWYLRDSERPPTEELIRIFHDWKEADPATFVDLADYGHVSEGPVLCLIGFQFNLVIDTTMHPGFLYVTKRGLSGDVTRRVRQAVRGSLDVIARLEAEPGYPEEVQLSGDRLHLGVNDRLNFPNSDETDRLLRPAFIAVLRDLYGEGGYSLEREMDPARCYGCEVAAAEAKTVAALRRSLGC